MCPCNDRARPPGSSCQDSSVSSPTSPRTPHIWAKVGDPQKREGGLVVLLYRKWWEVYWWIVLGTKRWHRWSCAPKASCRERDRERNSRLWGCAGGVHSQQVFSSQNWCYQWEQDLCRQKQREPSELWGKPILTVPHPLDTWVLSFYFLGK